MSTPENKNTCEHCKGTGRFPYARPYPRGPVKGKYNFMQDAVCTRCNGTGLSPERASEANPWDGMSASQWACWLRHGEDDCECGWPKAELKRKAETQPASEANTERKDCKYCNIVLGIRCRLHPAQPAPTEPAQGAGELERWVHLFLDKVRWDEDARLKPGEKSWPEQLIEYIAQREARARLDEINRAEQWRMGITIHTADCNVWDALGWYTKGRVDQLKSESADE